MLVQNRKAYHEYTIVKEYVGGLNLFGSEVKALRAGTANLNDSFVYISEGEIFIKGMHISKLKHACKHHEEGRERKILLKKREIQDLHAQVQQKGFTIVPLGIYDNNGFLKIRIALSKGKHLYDKKAALKEKDIKLQTQRELING